MGEGEGEGLKKNVFGKQCCGIRDGYPESRIGIFFIPDPRSQISRISIKEFKYFLA